MALLDLRWHLRGWRSQSRWAGTRAGIANWLAQAPEGHNDLLLFGASAGWMMDDAFLARFRRIDAVDFESASAPLFKFNHRRVIARQQIEVRFHNAEALSRLEEFLSMRPKALVLFDNLLGQYTLTCPDVARAEATLSGLAARLVGHSWGSVHDAISGPGQTLPLAQEPASMALHAGQQWPEERLLDAVGASGQWRDHLTRTVLPVSAPSRLLPWQLAPGYWHWLQAGWVRG